MSQPRARYRIRYAKEGPLRWIGHLDLIRLWERLLRRAKLSLKMTEGFHPKPKMSFPGALALGSASRDEVIELELNSLIESEELALRLRADKQPGLDILSVVLVPDGYGKAKAKASTYNLSIASADVGAIQSQIDSLRERETIEITRKEKVLKFKTAEQVLRLEIEGEMLVFTLSNGDGANLKPTDLIGLLEIENIVEDGQHLVRTRLELENEIDSQTRVTEKQTS